MLTLILSRFSVAMLNISKYKHWYTSLKTKPHQQSTRMHQTTCKLPDNHNTQI